MTALVLALLLAAEAPAPPPAEPTGPGVGAELLGLVYLRTDPIDGGLIGDGTLGGLATLDAEAAFGRLFSPESGLRLAAELLVVRLAWGEGEGTDALRVEQSGLLGSARARVGWAFGERLQLQPFLSIGPAVITSRVDYRVADPAIGTTVEESRAGWLPGLTAAAGALVSWPLGDRVLLLGRLEVDVVRRGGTTDAAFGAGLGVQVGHASPSRDAPRPR